MLPAGRLADHFSLFNQAVPLLFPVAYRCSLLRSYLKNSQPPPLPQEEKARRAFSSWGRTFSPQQSTRLCAIPYTVSISQHYPTQRIRLNRSVAAHSSHAIRWFAACMADSRKLKHFHVILGGSMTGRDFIAGYRVADTPAICQSACISCQNKMTCRTIAKAVAAIGSDEVSRSASPGQRKKYATIADHLRREGFSYPNVTDAGACWLFHKFGVAVFYENQLSRLADDIFRPVTRGHPTDYELRRNS
jgi:hypothetical protein